MNFELFIISLSIIKLWPLACNELAIETSKSAKQSGSGITDDQLVGVAKVASNYNYLVKGSSTRQKLQNSKGYTESPEFSPALWLIIFGKKSVATTLR